MSDAFQQIKDRLSILDLLRSLNTDANLRERGGHWYGNCPTGHDSHGGTCFHVWPDEGKCKCFHAGCELQGDVFDILKAVRRCDDADALREAAQLAGVALIKQSPEEREATKRREQRKKDTKSVLTDMALWAMEQLLERQELLDGLQRMYGFTRETVERWTIGFVPLEKSKDHDGLTKHLLSKGWSPEQIRSASICKCRTSNPSTMRCVFANRITFPFWDGEPGDQRSFVVYMTSRLVDARFTANEALWTPEWDATGKYHALAVYKDGDDKRSHIDPSLARRPFNEGAYAYILQDCDGKDLEAIPDVLVAVEGPADAIAIAELGIRCVGMGGGTISDALSSWLLKCTRNKSLVILGDNDGEGDRDEQGKLRPGLQGALATAQSLDVAGYTGTRLVLCPDGPGGGKEDPASWVMKLGGTREERRKAVLDHLEKACSALDKEIELLHASNGHRDGAINALILRIMLRPELDWDHFLQAIKVKLSLSNEEFKVVKRKLKEAHKEAEKEKKKGHLRLVKGDEIRSPQSSTVKEQVGDPDAPMGELVVPDGYIMSSEGIVAEKVNWMGNTSLEMVSPAPIYILGRVHDLVDSTTRLRLVWKRNGHWRERMVDRSDAFDGGAPMRNLARFDLPVGGDNSKELSRFLNRFETENFKVIPSLMASSQLGWLENWKAFLLGQSFITADSISVVDASGETPDWSEDVVAFVGKDAGDRQLAHGYRPEGCMADWIDLVNRLTPYPRAVLAILASMASPFLDVVDCRNWVLDLSGHTSLGKTTALRLAASVWGVPFEDSPDGVLGSWDTTRVGFERAATVRNHLPLILDDTKRQKKTEEIAAILYASTQGQGRGRGAKGGGLTTISHWRHILLSSGEQPVTSFTQDGGTRARVLTLNGSPFGGKSNATSEIIKAIDACLSNCYGHAGSVVIQWLLTHRDEWPALKEQYEAWKRRIVGAADFLEEGGTGGGSARLAGYAALLALVADKACEMLPGWAACPHGGAIVLNLWDELKGDIDDAVGGRRALELVVAWATANQTRFHGRHKLVQGEAFEPHQGWAGKWDSVEKWESIEIFPNLVKIILKTEGFEHAESIFSDWKMRGWLDADPKAYTKSRRFLSDRARLLIIRRSAIEEACRLTETIMFDGMEGKNEAL